MFQQLAAGITLLHLPILAMAIFGTIFLTVLLRVCQRARKPEYDRMATLPLQDDSQKE